jgi:aromatic-L-amino-acid/L-tryptophan decarboxylase
MRIDLDALEAAIAADRDADRRGIAVVASAGTIMSGAIDPLAKLAEIARSNDLWFHVDGAYGTPAALAEPAKFDGLALADSISLDAHKWLYQALDCSILLHRHAELARRTFAYGAEYVKTTSDDPIEGFAFFDQTLELSRRFRALKVWLSLRYHGLAAFREAVGENLRQARLLAQRRHCMTSFLGTRGRLEQHGPVARTGPYEEVDGFSQAMFMRASSSASPPAARRASARSRPAAPVRRGSVGR